MSQVRYAPSPDLTPRSRKPLWPWLVLLAFTVCMAFLYIQYQRIQAEAEQAAPPAAVVPAPVANATNTTAEANATQPEANATAGLSASAPEPPAPAVAPAASASPSGQALAPQNSTAAVPAAAIEVSRKTPAAPAAEVRTPGVQSLTFTAKGREVCWVGVYEGQKATTFLLRDGESRQVEFAKGVRVRLGNAGGISVRLNGMDYPIEGDRGQKVTLEIGGR